MRMIDRVADALYRSDFGEGMEGRPEHEKTVYREYARVAIEAIWAPSDETDAWHAMVDAALAP